MNATGRKNVLSDDDRLGVRFAYAQGVTQAELAEAYGVTQPAISAVVGDICRKHLNLTCHLCGKVKSGIDFKRTLYEMAFHYDRRHRGWTS